MCQAFNHQHNPFVGLGIPPPVYMLFQLHHHTMDLSECVSVLVCFCGTVVLKALRSKFKKSHTFSSLSADDGYFPEQRHSRIELLTARLTTGANICMFLIQNIYCFVIYSLCCRKRCLVCIPCQFFASSNEYLFCFLMTSIIERRTF